MSRPICVHCGKPYGQRATHDETVHREIGEPWPPYRGDGVVMKQTALSDTATTAYRTIWDGKSWRTPYQPFCKLRCALDYARKAYAATKRRET